MSENETEVLENEVESGTEVETPEVETEETETSESESEVEIPETDLTFDTWFASQPKHIQQLIQNNVAGLKRALQAEREGHKKFKNVVKNVAGLEAVIKERDALQAQMNFTVTALKGGLPAASIDLAWAAAQTPTGGKARKADGTADVAFLRKTYPQLFVGTETNIGRRGTGGVTASNMNELIRERAGRSS